MAKENAKALAGKIKLDAMGKLQIHVEENAVTIDSLVNKVVSNYCRELDVLMQDIKAALQDENNPLSDRDLDELALQLPVWLYFAGDGQETLGVREDVAKAVKMEMYNDAYAKAAGTIPQKQAQAELSTQDEYLVHAIYERAYKKIKLKMEYGYEMLQSIKKVISRRMAAWELSHNGGNR